MNKFEKKADISKAIAYFFDPRAVSTSKPIKKFGIRSRINIHGLVSVKEGVINICIGNDESRNAFIEKAKKFSNGGAEKWEAKIRYRAIKIELVSIFFLEFIVLFSICKSFTKLQVMSFKSA